MSPNSSIATSSGVRTPISRPTKRTKKADHLIDLVAEKLQEPADKPQEFDSLGKHIAEQMRKISKEQAVYLCKIINDGIFEAQCGTLTRRSRIVTPAEYVISEHGYLTSERPVHSSGSSTQGSTSNTLAHFFLT